MSLEGLRRLAGLMLVALVAAGPVAPPPAPPRASCGTVVIPNGVGQSDPSAVTGLNPLVSQSLYNTQARILLYRPVIWIGQDDRADYANGLASGVEVLDGNTRFRVTLKDWVWSDGVPITADDVKFCWELIGKLGPIFAFGGQGGIPDQVARFTVLDAHRFEVVLKSAANPDWFIPNGLSLLYALPRHAWGNISKDEMWRRQSDPSLFRVVDGPFAIEDFALDRYLSLVPNPRYGGHRSTLKRLVIDFLQGSNALHALQAGEVDMAHIPFALWDQMKDTRSGRILRLPPSFGYRSFIPNMKNARDTFFQDARVRRALADAMDQKAMIALVYHGFSHEAYTAIPPEPPTYLSPAARAGKLEVGYDPARAARELDAAGWKPGPDGVRAKGGVRLSFSVIVSVEAPDRIQELQIAQQNWRAIGVEMSIRPVTFNQLLAIMYGPPSNWDVILLSWTLQGFPDGSTYFDTGGSNNVGGYSDPTMDRLIHDSVGKAGLEGLWAYQDYVAAQQPWIFFPEGAYPLLVRPGVTGVEQFTSSVGYWMPEFLSVSSENVACHASHPDRPA